MNAISKAAAILGRKGGQSGTGISKARRSEIMKHAAQARWGVRSLESRFWSKVKKGSEEECWPWIGCRNNAGYGQFSISKGNSVTAHRMVYELSNGRIPDGVNALHRCDNPPCCNPKHIFLGTPKDNTQDMFAKGRARPPKGSDNGHAKLTDEKVVEIRRLRTEEHLPIKVISARFQVSKSTICEVVSRKKWKHL